ncbi:dihydrodipicolinate synthase family protein [Vannielia litorea]|uniref:dihydrodipicolinate synthase family protein n=1 Tax=Vannielia litorea TaxID=1217970 RepID=UPI001C98893D|nr:dihydrodipicolinate synthase family protein [Vannielia litorea]MBY6151646.1 dihydrodipicolinate synthase family protein [Vannielia litorea]
MAGLILPGPEGLAPYTPGAASDFAAPEVPMNRIAFTAAHVVADPLADVDPWLTPAIDWEATLAYRHHLWEHGFAVAEAMDTAQRGMGLGWEEALELIRRSVTEAKGVPGASVFSGVGTDHLAPSPELGIDAIIAAYLEQLAAVQGAGGRVILMASRALAAAAKSAEDYARIYSAVLAEADEPVIIHWLGDMFDPALAGYWGSDDIPTAMNTCLAILKENASKIDGIKISLLSKEAEIDMRRRLPDGVRMYTGDDFNYAELIEGDEHGYSDALLGIFDAIAPAASAALKHLAAGNSARFNEILAPTAPLSRHIFKAPTRFYKTGVVFLAWLNGHQSHFTMVGGQESTRSTLHLAELFRLADKAGLLTDPDRASARMADLMRTRGVA